jgi:ribose transport system substrate-binding protein
MFPPLTAFERSLLVSLLALASALIGCDAGSAGLDARPGVKRMVMLINVESAYWSPCRLGMEKASHDLKLSDAGLSAVMESNDGTSAGQIQKLRQFASQSDIVAVAISPVDATNAAIADEMRKLRKKGVRVIAIDNDAERSTNRDAREYYIGTDNIAAGREFGLAAKALLPEGGKFVDFVGRTGAQGARDRMDGIKLGAGPKFEELDRMADEADSSKARQNVRHALINFPDVKLLNGIYAYNTPAIVDVVRELNKRDQVKILAFDAEEGTIERMGQGMVEVMVVQDPYGMGYQGVRLMKALLDKDEATVHEMFPHAGEPDGDLYDTGTKIVVPKDSPLKAEDFGATSRFMPLEEFKKWLAEHGLKNS